MPPLREQQMEVLLANIKVKMTCFSRCSLIRNGRSLWYALHLRCTGTRLEPSFQIGRPIACQFVRLQGKLLTCWGRVMPNICLTPFHYVYYCTNLMFAMFSFGAPSFSHWEPMTWLRRMKLLSRTRSRLQEISRHMEAPFLIISPFVPSFQMFPDVSSTFRMRMPRRNQRTEGCCHGHDLVLPGRWVTLSADQT